MVQDLTWVNDPVSDIVGQTPISMTVKCKPRCGTNGECDMLCSPLCDSETFTIGTNK